MKNNTLWIVGGLLAAGVAFFVLWKKGTFNTTTPTRAALPPVPAGDNTAAYLQAGTSLFSDILDRL